MTALQKCSQLILLLLAGTAVSAFAIDLPVTGDEYGVVSSHYLATEAGFEILEEGGNAADAAFTVASVLGVVEGWFSNPLGGEVWALHYNAEDGEITGLDGVGPAGSHATLEFWQNEENSGSAGMHQAVVPGGWDSWMIWLSRFGSMELPRLLERAVDLAENGFPVSSVMRTWIQNDEKEIRRWPISREIFLPDGKVPETGDTLYLKGMARTYRQLIEAYEEARPEGRDAAFQAARDYFYRGPIAEKIVAYSKEHGGLFEISDFRNYEASFVDPISIQYKDDISVYQCPPNSQGITMLMTLAILREYDISEIQMQSPRMIHLITEAIKLAQADKYYYVGDPSEEDVPVDQLLSEEYAQSQRERIDMSEAKHWPLQPGLSILGSGEAEEAASNTTTYQVIDSEGNGVSVTTSLGANFLVVGDTGIIINNRMRMFSDVEGNPNAVAPGKKVRHTSNPYIALKSGDLYIMGGNTGVDSQPQGQVQQFIYVVEYGTDPQDAVSRSRFISHSFPASTPPYEASNTLSLEGGYTEATRNALREMGHNVGKWAIYGNANMAVVDPQTGTLSFGADPRGVNKALAR